MILTNLNIFNCSAISFPHSNLLFSHQLPKFCNTSNVLTLKSYANYWICTPNVFKGRGVSTVNVAFGADGEGSEDRDVPSESDDEDSLLLGDLPLDPKLQLKLEQKMRMKLSKKIRLRRKKLDRKRHLSKRGRWRLSKMKKNKNV